ncbi:hypothetical protein M406DRAFT_102166 [Cryphonectria parasitica EP155]|uniref:Uncharacterized protein n=1 Tax=Cryphonectria parasitica (strain ATCC 38755 / EP155) TaxID=660469 RepID=A0A9P5CQW2_CRYP1|nr:uncharacterized protein M406DRAFT_102166 [Cryphonectria parasitica EP155]KAF3767929.1 hypothetical protein M406DRAFT_102166 [Cryphonectria parasitica EP155]
MKVHFWCPNPSLVSASPQLRAIFPSTLMVHLPRSAPHVAKAAPRSCVRPSSYASPPNGWDTHDECPNHSSEVWHFKMRPVGLDSGS